MTTTTKPYSQILREAEIAHLEALLRSAQDRNDRAAVQQLIATLYQLEAQGAN